MTYEPVTIEIEGYGAAEVVNGSALWAMLSENRRLQRERDALLVAAELGLAELVDILRDEFGDGESYTDSGATTALAGAINYARQEHHH